jgi:Zn-dependent protease with chaperone function
MEYRPRTPREGINVSARHPLAELVTLIAGISGVVVVLLVAAFLFIEVLIAWIPPSFESRVFGGLWSADVQSGQEDPRFQAAAALLGRLASHWEGNPYQLRLAIMDAESPNAFAVPGGVIFLTRGLLDSIESENELAFVLGHELGHFRNRDHLRGIGRGVIVSLTLSALVGGSGAKSIPQLVTTLTERRFAREQERAADAFGLALVEAEYGHVAGADDFLERLPDATADGADEFASYFATHPVSEARIENLRGIARENGWSLTGELTPFPR